MAPKIPVRGFGNPQEGWSPDKDPRTPEFSFSSFFSSLTADTFALPLDLDLDLDFGQCWRKCPITSQSLHLMGEGRAWSVPVLLETQAVTHLTTVVTHLLHPG